MKTISVACTFITVIPIDRNETSKPKVNPGKMAHGNSGEAALNHSSGGRSC